LLTPEAPPPVGTDRMCATTSDLLPMLESLGDNCELGGFLRENNLETGSLLRWVLCSIDEVIAYIERAEWCVI